MLFERNGDTVITAHVVFVHFISSNTTDVIEVCKHMKKFYHVYAHTLYFLHIGSFQRTHFACPKYAYYYQKLLYLPSPSGWQKFPPCGGVWIFSGMTHLQFYFNPVAALSL
jgi:hypothetical protein